MIQNLSLKTLEAQLASINSDNIDPLFNEHLYGVEDSLNRKSLSDIYGAISNLSGESDETKEKFYQLVNGTTTSADLTTTYTTVNAVAQRLGTIDSLLDLSSVTGSTAYDTIDEMSAWCVANVELLQKASDMYLSKGTILTGTADFNSDMGDENSGKTEVSLGKTIADSKYKVVVLPTENTEGDLGELFVEKYPTKFNVWISGNTSTAFDWMVIPEVL